MNIIDELSRLTKTPIELAWNNTCLKGISVIEVYPAATLECYGIINSGYKEKGQHVVRREIIAKLREFMTISNDVSLLEQNADALDSSVCLLAAKDFIEVSVYYPEDLNLAKKEGWIWVRKV